MDLADRRFAAVIFDNDGTLVDSTGSVVRSWVRWAQEYDVDPERLNGFHGVPAASIIAAIAPHVDPAAAFARIEALETADVDDVVALPGVLAAVADLAGAPIAVVTSATRGLLSPTVSSTFCWPTRGLRFSACCLSVTARCVLLSEQLLVVQGFPRFRRGIPASRRGCPSAAGP